MAGLIDKDAELARLQKSQDKLKKEVGRFESKLSNEHFVSNSPDDVIAEKGEKLEDAKSAYDKLAGGCS